MSDTTRVIGPESIKVNVCPDCNEHLRFHPSWCEKTGRRHECPDNVRSVKYVRADRLAGAVEAERERIVALIRREAAETFDMQLGDKWRQLADRIAASQPECGGVAER
jgi:hypothetical protein